MFVHYWFGTEPNSTVSAAQVKALAQVARGQSTTYAASGVIVAAGLRISSGIAEPTAVIDIGISPSTGTTKVVGTTDGSTAIVGAALSDSGCIAVTALTATGGSVRRYVKLFAT